MLAGSPVLLPQSSHSSSFSMPHPTSPLSCSFLPSPPLWLLGEASQQCHACHVRQIPRDRTETRALSFHLWGGSCRLHPLRALRDPTSPPPPARRLVGRRSLAPHPVPSASHLLGWNAGQIDPGVGVAGASVTASLPATPSASPFSEIHTIPPLRKAGGDAGSLHGGPAASPPAPLQQDHTLHT